MVIAEEDSTSAKETHDIDLKCAEKVTDSDNEENVEAGENKVSNDQASNDGQQQDASRDITCKPKPIKAQRQTIESPLLKYQQVYLNAYSPKNPTGILPFQPTGKLKATKTVCLFVCSHTKILRILCSLAGGAFKTMPVSPKDVKPISSGSSTDTTASDNENDVDVKPSSPTVFTFTGTALPNSK